MMPVVFCVGKCLITSDMKITLQVNYMYLYIYVFSVLMLEQTSIKFMTDGVLLKEMEKVIHALSLL